VCQPRTMHGLTLGGSFLTPPPISPHVVYNALGIEPPSHKSLCVMFCCRTWVVFCPLPPIWRPSRRRSTCDCCFGQSVRVCTARTLGGWFPTTLYFFIPRLKVSSPVTLSFGGQSCASQSPLPGRSAVLSSRPFPPL